VNLEPTRGGELQKNNRPVLVLSRPGIGTPGVSLCAPITDFKPERDKLRYWRVVIGDSEESGLSKLSCADVSQTRALDISRFVSQDGEAHDAETEASAAALALCVGYTPPAPDRKSKL
jgi:mRNA-degrading endonuclease toxin of MazEF toxin-antitoxin module